MDQAKTGMSRERPLSEIDFARQAAFMAAEASRWSGDAIDPATLAPGGPMDPSTVARFTDKIRDRCDLIDDWAGRPPRPEDEARRLRALLESVDRELERLAGRITGDVRAAIDEVRATVARGNRI